MKLQVQLTLIYGKLSGAGEDLLHCALQCGPPVFRQSLKIFHPLYHLDVLEHRAAATVALTYASHEYTLKVLVTDLVPDMHNLLRLVLSLIGIYYHVGRNAGAVQTFPDEKVIGEGICVIPPYLARYEVINTGALQDLGQLCIVAKGVGNPEDSTLNASEELPYQPAPIYELSDKGLPGGQHAVRLNPAYALNLKAAFGFITLHLPEDRRIAVTDCLHLYRLGEGERELRELIHVLHHLTGGSRGLSLSLRNRP